MLLLTLAPVVLLSEYLAVIVDFGIEDLDLPAPLGGMMIAVLVLSPEGLTAFHAALVNHLQRAVNVCLGSALATIGLTIPAVLMIGLVTGREVHLGLSRSDRTPDPDAVRQRAHLRRRAAPMCCKAWCTCCCSSSMWR